MKMENAIKSPVAGIVHNVTTSEGGAIEKGALLCVVEPQS
jgi:biotin carboxyl carrier protein